MGLSFYRFTWFTLCRNVRDRNRGPRRRDPRPLSMSRRHRRSIAIMSLFLSFFARNPNSGTRRWDAGSARAISHGLYFRPCLVSLTGVDSSFPVASRRFDRSPRDLHICVYVRVCVYACVWFLLYGEAGNLVLCGMNSRKRKAIARKGGRTRFFFFQKPRYASRV